MIVTIESTITVRGTEEEILPVANRAFAMRCPVRWVNTTSNERLAIEIQLPDLVSEHYDEAVREILGT